MNERAITNLTMIGVGCIVPRGDYKSILDS